MIKTLGRKKLPWLESIYVAAYFLIVVVSCFFISNEFTLRVILESIHRLKPLVGFSFVIFVYFFSPFRYWVFLSSFTLILFGMRYFIYEALSNHTPSALLWAAWMDTKWFLLLTLPLGIIVTLLKHFGFHNRSHLGD